MRNAIRKISPWSTEDEFVQNRFGLARLCFAFRDSRNGLPFQLSLTARNTETQTRNVAGP